MTIARLLRTGVLVAALGLAAGAARAAVPGDAVPIHGLTTMGKLNFVDRPGIVPDNSLREARAHPGLYSGAVILATWAQLEPQPGQYDFSTIQQGLDNVRAYNRQNPGLRLHGKLRVFAGPNAPDWAKQLGGSPVTLHERDQEAVVGRVWSRPYRAAWAALQQKLAARFDTDPDLQEVAISSCASSTAEPFVIPLNPRNLPALHDAGYSDAAMEACLTGALDDYAPWRNVAVDYTFNPWRDSDGGRIRPDPQFTISVMDAFRARYGSRGVIGNHGLTPQINPPARTLLAEMHRLGPPIEFQTRGPIQDWDGSMATAERVGVSELEIWDTRDAGGHANVTLDQLRTFKSELAQ